MFKSKGKIEVTNGIRILTDLDFILYYKWLIDKYNYNTIKLQIPKHLGHITIVNPKIHKNVDCELARKYHGDIVDFTYDPFNMYISKVNYWIPVKCVWADMLKKDLNVDDGYNYWGLHITIANKKFND